MPSTLSISRAACALVVGSTWFLSVAVHASGSDWMRFRGPNGSGIGEVVDLPNEFSRETAEWTRQVPFGRSSPIVAGGRVFLTAADGDRLVTTAFDARTGAQLWLRSVPRLRVDEVMGEAGPAIATPVTDGASVFVFFPEFGLVSYDLDGAERWRHDLPPFRSYYGMAASPILEDGVLILLCDQTGAPYLLGVDAETGAQRWRLDRSVRGESWTTPVVFRSGTPEALVLTFGTFVVDAYRPATGELAWRLPGLGAGPVASPVIAGDKVFVVAPDQGETSEAPTFDSFAALDDNADRQLTREELAEHSWGSAFPWLDQDGDGVVSFLEVELIVEMASTPDFGLVAIDLSFPDEPTIVWRQKRTLPYIASPILYRDVLFLIKDGGILTSYDPETGDVLKRGRIAGAVEPFSPSPIAADGKLYLTSNDGTLAVVRAAGEWETLGISDLDERIDATPAIGEGRMFLRTRSRLMSFRGGSQPQGE